MPMRINGRVPELGGDALLKPFRDEVFQSLRLFMNLFQRIIEHFIEKGLDQPMMTQDFESAPLSRL